MTKINIVNEKFGKLTVLYENGKYKNGTNTLWHCRCDCGNECDVPTGSLKRGLTKSCGCERYKPKDLTGQKFGRLLAIRISGKNIKKRNYIWECQCDCGNIVNVLGSSLSSNCIRSCGCLSAESHRLPEGEASKNVILYRYKRRAKELKLEFKLSEQDFFKLTRENCYYCGLKPSSFQSSHNEVYNKAYVYNGIDRLDNSKGYVIDNCVPCCEWCNKSKNKRNLLEFREWAIRFIEYNKSGVEW